MRRWDWGSSLCLCLNWPKAMKNKRACQQKCMSGHPLPLIHSMTLAEHPFRASFVRGAELTVGSQIAPPPLEPAVIPREGREHLLPDLVRSAGSHTGILLLGIQQQDEYMPHPIKIIKATRILQYF